MSEELRPIIKEAIRFRQEATIREWTEFYEDAVRGRKELDKAKAEIARLEEAKVYLPCPYHPIGESIDEFGARLEAENAKLKAEGDRLRAVVGRLVKALEYCSVEPEYLQPESNRQCAVAMSALAEARELLKNAGDSPLENK